MKRYLIFAAIVPLIGGFIMMFTTAYQSGYLAETNAGEIGKLLLVFIKTLQYSYLFGIVPALVMASIDDILAHVRRIGWVMRVLIISVLSFAVAELIYGSRGPDSGLVQFILYGLVGLVPGMISSVVAHKYADDAQPAVQKAS